MLKKQSYIGIIIFLIIIGLLLVATASSQLNKSTDNKLKIVAELDTTNLNEETINNIASFYSSKIKEKPTSYATDGIFVIINFNNTNKRIITKKDRFDKLIVEEKKEEE